MSDDKPAETPLKISFCTTCKGRLDHLMETLPKNLENSKSWPNVEFVILAYNDVSVIHWVLENYPEEVRSGKIVLSNVEMRPEVDEHGRVVSPEFMSDYFYYSHAKNAAHRMASGDVLCNLDADNIMAPGYARWLGEAFTDSFKTGKDIIARPLRENSGNTQVRGSGGRIAISRENFYKLRGYEEAFDAWGGEDR